LKSCWFCDKFRNSGEFETKFSFAKKYLTHSIKPVWKENFTVPSLEMTHLFSYDPFFVGLNATFDTTSKLYHKIFEIMVGAKPIENHLIYLKQ